MMRRERAGEAVVGRTVRGSAWAVGAIDHDCLPNARLAVCDASWGTPEGMERHGNDGGLPRAARHHRALSRSPEFQPCPPLHGWIDRAAWWRQSSSPRSASRRGVGSLQSILLSLRPLPVLFTLTMITMFTASSHPYRGGDVMMIRNHSSGMFTLHVHSDFAVKIPL